MMYIILFISLAAFSFGQQATLKCGPGEYINFKGDGCEPCPQGTFYKGVGALGPRSCRPCPRNTFSRPGAKDCIPCPSGLVSAPGAGSCIFCKPGTAVDVPFSFDQPGNVVCKPCVNSYTSKPNQEECILCPIGHIAAPGSTSLDQCIRCQPGTEPDFNQNKCVGCRFDEVQDGKTTIQCQTCAIGSISNRKNTECLPCLPGDYGIRISGPRSFIYLCTPCPNGSTTFGYGNNFCKAPNADCPPERYTTSLGDCLLCEPDHFLVKTGRERCQSCPAGQGSVGGLVEKCESCKDIVRKGIKTSRCFGEPFARANIISRLIGKDENDKCPPGSKVSTRFSYACELCSVDTFSAEKDSKLCQACPENTYTRNKEGQSSCTPCSQGSPPFVNSCVVPRTGCPPDQTLVRQEFSSFCKQKNPNDDFNDPTDMENTDLPEVSMSVKEEDNMVLDEMNDSIRSEIAMVSRE